MKVEHQADEHRFVAETEHGQALLSYRMEGTDTVNMAHTEVPRKASGEGLGSKMVQTALDWARQENLKVVPGCPFVRSWIEDHPDYQDLIAS